MLKVQMYTVFIQTLVVNLFPLFATVTLLNTHRLAKGQNTTVGWLNPTLYSGSGSSSSSDSAGSLFNDITTGLLT